LSYKAVDVDAYSNLDNDTWSYYEALALVICLGYQCSQLRLWWKLIEVNFEDGLKQFSDDKHALELEEYAVNNNGEANLYVEHLSVNQPQYISYEELLQLAHAFLDEDEGERNGAHVDENDGAEVGHEDVQHVVQMLKLVLRWRGEEAPKGGTDGGVGPYENDVVDDGGSQNVVNESGDVVCHNENGADNVMSTGQFEDEDDSFSPSTSKASDEDIDDDTEFVDDMGSADNTGACLAHFAFDLPNMDDVGDDVDANYMSEELDNGSKSDEDGNFRPRRSIGFGPHELCKEFKFRLHMQFSSLTQFKEAIMEHFVLNEKEVIFIKNIKKGARVVCSQKCGFLCLVSRVGRTETFEVKTLTDEHTCPRVFNKKNAKSKWVARQILDRLKSNPHMTMNEVVDDIRSRYATSITSVTSYKARQIALAIVEGDAIK